MRVAPLFDVDTFDAIVTDPPAGIGFMGKEWDHDRGGRHVWIDWMTALAFEMFAVLKPGGHALVWALPRTSHWTATALEDAGFEVRDRVSHLFGSGFPKSLDVSKQLDRIAGVEREVVAVSENGSGPHQIKLDNHGKGDTGIGYMDGSGKTFDITAPATDSARQWNGWGTALKPACEDWWLVRKPLSEKTVAANVLRWGTGALNIDGCRISTNGEELSCSTAAPYHASDGSQRTWNPTSTGGMEREGHVKGRWPANVTHDGSAEVVEGFPESESTGGVSPNSPPGCNDIYGKYGNKIRANAGGLGDSGSAARFFYCAKASRADRGEDNKHPTVKNTDLMRWLCRLITPPDGLILDPFLGSGSTAVAAYNENFRIAGIENEREYWETAVRRVRAELKRFPLFEPPKPRQTELFEDSA